MRRGWLSVMVLIVFLSGCESLYYDMVMDKPETGKANKADKDDVWDKAGDVSRLRNYR